MLTTFAISFLDLGMMAVVAVILVFALSYILRAASLVVYHFHDSGDDDLDARRAVLDVARERVFENLRDLEMDHAMRKISDSDYQALREQSEAKAIEVIREIDELEEKGVHRRHMLIFLVGLGSLLAMGPTGEVMAQSMPSNHPPVGAPRMLPSVDTEQELFVRILKVSENGSLGPLGNAPVILEVRERASGPMSEESVVRTEMVRTDSTGSAQSLIEMSNTANIRGYVPHGDAVFMGDWSRDRTNPFRGYLFLIAYDTTRSWDDLSLEVFANLHQSQWRDKDQNLMVSEGQLTVSVEVFIRNDGLKAVDLRDMDNPFFLPLVAPVVGGRVVTRGWLPEQSGRHMSIQGPPMRGEVSLEEGGMVYRGLVLPGKQTRMNYSYPLDVVASDTELGVVSENVPIENMTVGLQLREDVRGDLRFAMPSILKRDEPGEDGRTLKVHSIEGRVEAGVPIFVTVTHLPVEGEYTRSGSAWVVFIVLIGFLIALIRVRPRTNMGFRQASGEMINLSLRIFGGVKRKQSNQ